MPRRGRLFSEAGDRSTYGNSFDPFLYPDMVSHTTLSEAHDPPAKQLFEQLVLKAKRYAPQFEIESGASSGGSSRS